MSTIIFALIGVVVWVACGIAAAGYFFAYFQRKWPTLADENREEDKRAARVMVLGGPIALLVACEDGGRKYGWLWPWSKPAKAAEVYAYSNSGEIVGVKVESGLLEDVHGVIAADSQNFDELPVPDSSGYFTLRPDWSKAPEWAVWAAQDASGAIAFYASEPEYSHVFDQWKNQNGDRWDFAAGHDFRHPGAPANPNWREAIEQRPATVKESLPVQVVKQSLTTPERDDNQLISRVELERLRDIASCASDYARNYQSQKNFERLCRACGVEL